MSFFNLPLANIFRLSGKDCARYLNARLSNNVRDLPAQRGLAAAALSPQGRTELFGSVLKISAEEFFFICDGGEAAENKSLLLRYKVADRVDCELLVDHQLLHIIGENPYQSALDALSEFQPFPIEGGYAFAHRRTSLPGYDFIVNKKVAHELVSGKTELDSEQQRVERIKAHRPAFPNELNDQSIFLESGLSHAISFTKGCYVGQEVMEKVDSHGRLPYTLTSLVSCTSTTPRPSDTPVTKSGSDARVGETISGALEMSSGLTYYFARVKTTALEPPGRLLVGETECEII